MKCGSQIMEDDVFCPKCGNKMAPQEQQSQQSQGSGSGSLLVGLDPDSTLRIPMIIGLFFTMLTPLFKIYSISYSEYYGVNSSFSLLSYTKVLYKLYDNTNEGIMLVHMLPIIAVIALLVFAALSLSSMIHSYRSGPSCNGAFWSAAKKGCRFAMINNIVILLMSYLAKITIKQRGFDMLAISSLVLIIIGIDFILLIISDSHSRQLNGAGFAGGLPGNFSPTPFGAPQPAPEPAYAPYGGETSPYAQSYAPAPETSRYDGGQEQYAAPDSGNYEQPYSSPAQAYSELYSEPYPEQYSEPYSQPEQPQPQYRDSSVPPPFAAHEPAPAAEPAYGAQPAPDAAAQYDYDYDHSAAPEDTYSSPAGYESGAVPITPISAPQPEAPAPAPTPFPGASGMPSPFKNKQPMPSPFRKPSAPSPFASQKPEPAPEPAYSAPAPEPAPAPAPAPSQYGYEDKPENSYGSPAGYEDYGAGAAPGMPSAPAPEPETYSAPAPDPAPVIPQAPDTYSASAPYVPQPEIPAPPPAPAPSPAPIPFPEAPRMPSPFKSKPMPSPFRKPSAPQRPPVSEAPDISFASGSAESYAPEMQAPGTWICEKCGQKNSAEYNICSFCGNTIE